MPDDGISRRSGRRVRSPWGRLAEMPNDSVIKTLAVALLVALFGSVIVSSTAILLRPRIEANLEHERQRNLLEIVRAIPGLEQLLEGIDAGAIEPVVVDVAKGEIDRTMRAEEIDPRAAAQDPARSLLIPPDRDIAAIRRRPSHEVVYLVRAEGELRLIVLPVHGQGFASTLYGYLGLAPDANTVVGLSFYEHGETPGLGAQIESPRWRGQWQGKRVRDADGQLRIGVARGPVTPGSSDAPYQVDGLTGATFTSQGVHNLIRFWLGDDGFGPFLDRIRQEGASP